MIWAGLSEKKRKLGHSIQLVEDTKYLWSTANTNLTSVENMCLFWKRLGHWTVQNKSQRVTLQKIKGNYFSMLLSTACCSNFSALAWKFYSSSKLHHFSVRLFIADLNIGNFTCADDAKVSIFASCLWKRGSTTLPKIIKRSSQQIFSQSLAVIIFLFNFVWSSSLYANLIENDIAAILMNRSHAPGKECHLSKEVARRPRHHHVQAKLKDSEGCQDNLIIWQG